MPLERKAIYFEILVTVGLMVIPSLIGAVFHFLHPEQLATQMTCPSWFFGSAIASSLLLIGLLWHIIRLNSESMDVFTNAFAPKDLLKGFGLWIWTAVSDFGTYQLLLSLWGGAQGGEAPSRLEPFRVPFSPLYLLAMIVIPCFEEFFVRGFLQTRLKQAGWNGLAVVLVSTLLQTSYHLYQGLVACLSLAPGFFILAAYYQTSRRLWPVIVAHIITDLFFMLLAIKA
jgi:membrane protease YdiL (CAAX protease family)